MDGVSGTADATPQETEQARLEALSQEILAEDDDLGANPDGHGGEPAETPAAPADETQRSHDAATYGEPKEGTEAGDGESGTATLPGWQQGMPDSLRGRLEGMSEDEIAWIQGNAESGLRQSDYSRRLNELPSRDQIAELMQSHQAMQAIQQDPELAVRMFKSGESQPQEKPSIAEIGKELMDLTDPDEFAGKLEEMLTIHGESVKDSLRQEQASAPDKKAQVVNAAAAKVREALGERYPDESWQKACADFQADIEEAGADWRDTPPDALPFLLKPYLKLYRPTSAPAPSPEAKPAPRAAAMPASGGPGLSTKNLTHAQREGRDESEDEIFDRVLAKFGQTEQTLAKLRAQGG